MAQDFIATQARVYKIIASGSTPTDKAKILIYGTDAATNYQGGINQSVFSTSSIGTDVFLFVSGAKNSKGLATNKISVFGGDLHVSGVLYADLGFSGSHTRLVNGLAAFLAGPYITINSNSAGQVEISSSLSFSAGPGIIINTSSNGTVIQISASSVSSPNNTGSIMSFGISDYATTVQTTYQAVGQLIFNASQYTGSIYLRSVLSTTNKYLLHLYVLKQMSIHSSHDFSTSSLLAFQCSFPP